MACITIVTKAWPVLATTRGPMYRSAGSKVIMTTMMMTIDMFHTFNSTHSYKSLAQSTSKKSTDLLLFTSMHIRLIVIQGEKTTVRISYRISNDMGFRCQPCCSTVGKATHQNTHTPFCHLPARGAVSSAAPEFAFLPAENPPVEASPSAQQGQGP